LLKLINNWYNGWKKENAIRLDEENSSTKTNMLSIYLP
jgi:hypothetical protein